MALEQRRAQQSADDVHSLNGIITQMLETRHSPGIPSLELLLSQSTRHGHHSQHMIPIL